MGFRFQRRIRIFKGFNINLSKSGLGFSFGPRGAKAGVNSKGQPYGSVGVPGTGLSYRQTFSKGGSEGEPSAQLSFTAKVVFFAIGLAAVVILFIAFLSSVLFPSSPAPNPPTTQKPISAPYVPPTGPIRVYTYPAPAPSAPSSDGALSSDSYRSPDTSSGDVSVKGYYRKDGTYVRAHRRHR